ncbi:glycoside hydrolase family 65 protein [Faecalibacter rhinopitheci]|uniref:Glycoside hydrolase family 65 protein n=1 Tax=Faecalibacter rhinopitheci TaxID=2779678 RepID=A0A8J7FN80_9FLAO|nr:glycoside hydrolase family 65 protein [Faecalibacter rhinopitheci]MBF0597547.1 glycoside hydrolase family 65 protein [Faecalibacter rhinopitheci]
MNQDYIIPNAWSIIEEGFEIDRVKSSESLLSIGNGAMGQRANFEEFYSGDTFQGSYIAGVYYPDKTKVGWWKNGYPEYFAKVLNAPVWIGINIEINGEQFDLNTCKEVKNFRRELNMKEGILDRSFVATLPSGLEIEVFVRRFLAADLDELGAIKYDIKPLNGKANIVFKPYVDAHVKNEDANWEEIFWESIGSEIKGEQGFVQARTFKTHYNVVTYMENAIFINSEKQAITPTAKKTEWKVEFTYEVNVKANETATIQKFGGYVVSTNHKEDELVAAAKNVLAQANALGYEQLLTNQKEAWAKTWEMADITIDGDVKAQQGIRFNIFQLNQTYSGKDARLNIGPKGFTGEKYGGSTYWDTEAYCLPFYMATKNQEVARNLLTYRYNQLDKAIENAEKLGFNKGAALYPMVTMNGEECHNEWEITFEEIHRNAAIAFAIFNYTRFTGDESYIPEAGLEVLLGIARFWKQRVNWSADKKQYVMLGVTGPNEYENNVNNNFHTSYCAQWCMNYLVEQVENVKANYPEDFSRIAAKTNITDVELAEMKEVAANIYFPYSEELGIYLQQDGFLDKDLTPVSELAKEERPINQKWSWDRILRSAYIKQADTLQAFYYFEDQFSKDRLEKHFDFYEPLTVHESSLSPCVHSIQAATLGRMEQAYTFYLRTSRLDLDDYNKEVHEGLHITSMAGTWMSIVEGFGGMRVKNDTLYFEPRLPEQWEGFSFKINFRNQILKVNVNKGETTFELEGTEPLEVYVFDQKVVVQPSI